MAGCFALETKLVNHCHPEQEVAMRSLIHIQARVYPCCLIVQTMCNRLPLKLLGTR